MTVKTWQKKIREACRQAGTWQSCFGPLADQLAETLAQRDEAREKFREEDGELLVEQASGKGYRLEPNPLLQLVSSLDQAALAMMRELGLTPRSMRQIKGSVEPEEPAKPAGGTVLELVQSRHRKEA